MRSYNKSILIGNLAADPELRHTKNGKEVTTFPLATNRTWQDTNGEKQSNVDFHRIVCWGNLAIIADQHLAKGTAIAVDGRLSNRVYENAKSEKVYLTEIIADNLNILNWKKPPVKTKVEA
ncbi:single-stranded DNA-binding protein [Candidatus Peregrinibacteria bacterium CG11_big_fil_rev_8_21_14_0_20_41_10]|nr:MAG: single-stranded DNA-binding protein [Candidatus Peregrinibacteria bacterium CG11_big_fil_rev_8_21_14_0_20_41_10]PIZ76213.1 MAG: single-stranded DNA-binding protein [Candidatus Peregrinibacteria bacterium CG_4_10_14_0_2_um_filter_41_8]PJC37564.1 MAG: single-stranded DNA-binding protein [Candidatus Peregrinibacteria bacterium CG_4_9_14_0_2_um_filter_41_14]